MGNPTSDQRGYIDVVEVRFNSHMVVLKDAFEFREDRPAHWLQRLCIWTLRKLQCYASKETVTVTRHQIGKHGDRFMDRLWKAKAALCGSFDMRPSPTKLLIGAEDYAALMDESASSAAFDFQARYFTGRDTVIGLQVQVIPWMRGMLVLP